MKKGLKTFGEADKKYLSLHPLSGDRRWGFDRKYSFCKSFEKKFDKDLEGKKRGVIFVVAFLFFEDAERIEVLRNIEVKKLSKCESQDNSLMDKKLELSLKKMI